ncbi:CLUMA_CG011050, isoform F [Clunio marinus]|uniref:CLUMA_CG011050, isoform F n=1 Tax=Clunio marinus TaxID=568069 RepID=A0A1J1IGV7_9DIPT|nr:CLUMA_CG011050, isoform F [Clunio marinus]
MSFESRNKNQLIQNSFRKKKWKSLKCLTVHIPSHAELKTKSLSSLTARKDFKNKVMKNQNKIVNL